MFCGAYVCQCRQRSRGAVGYAVHAGTHRCRCRVEAPAVVLNGEGQAPGVVAEPDGRAGWPGLLRRALQRFQHRGVSSGLGLLRVPADHVRLDRHCRLAGLRLERCPAAPGRTAAEDRSRSSSSVPKASRSVSASAAIQAAPVQRGEVSFYSAQITGSTSTSASRMAGRALYSTSGNAMPAGDAAGHPSAHLPPGRLRVPAAARGRQRSRSRWRPYPGPRARARRRARTARPRRRRRPSGCRPPGPPRRSAGRPSTPSRR